MTTDPSPSPRRAGGASYSLRHLAEVSEIGVLLVSTDGDVEYLNPYAESLFGLGLDETEAWRRVVGFLRSGMLRPVDDEPARRSEVEFDWTKGDERKRVACRIHYLEEDECTAFLVLAQDAGAMRALEMDLAAAAQLRGINRLYVSFTHDLRAPLNSVVLNLEVLKRTLAGRDASVEGPTGAGSPVGDGTGWAARISHLEEDLERLAETLDSVLLQTVIGEPGRTLFDLCEVVRELRPLLEGQAGHDGVEIEIVCPPNAVPVHADRSRLKQALLNLSINAFEAVGQGGTVQLEVARDGRMAVVRVVDDGPGVPDEVLPRLFDMHFTTKSTGTGVGLFVARSTFQASDGSLELVENGGPVTVFEGRVPLEDPGAAPGEAAEDETGRLAEPGEE